MFSLDIERTKVVVTKRSKEPVRLAVMIDDKIVVNEKGIIKSKTIKLKKPTKGHVVIEFDSKKKAELDVDFLT